MASHLKNKKSLSTHFSSLHGSSRPFTLCLPMSYTQHPSSTTPPIDIAPSRLKLMRRGPDRKSEFLRALKDEGTGELTTSSSPGTSGEVGGGLVS